jgi:anti-sigma factor RsiW
LRSTDEMTCRELVEVVTDYLEGALAVGDCHRLERHLEGCRHCVRYIDQMRRTIRTLGELSVESIAPETRRELLAAFRGWRDR